jgi:filamentous hemagglutinin
MLWYVEQSVPDPSCVSTGPVACPTITALMPQVYLPQNWSAMCADGTITGKDVTLNLSRRLALEDLSVLPVLPR